MSTFNAAEELREQTAVRWHTIMTGGAADGAQIDAFNAWHAADDRNARVYGELEELTGTIAQLQDLRFSNDLLEAIPLAPARSSRPRLEWLTAVPKSALGLAAAVMITTLAVFLWSTPETYTSTVGQVRRIALSDGSLLTLGADSEVRVDISSRERDIELTRGQAFFIVHKDPARPFLVKADGGSIRAVGTQFDVVRRPRGVTVTVVEGQVKVRRSVNDGASTAPALVSAGEKITFSRKNASIERLAAAADMAVAWQSNRLVYKNEPLLNVVADIDRYVPQRITLGDAELGELEVTAVVDTRDPLKLLRAIGLSLGLTESESADEIILSRP